MRSKGCIGQETQRPQGWEKQPSQLPTPDSQKIELGIGNWELGVVFGYWITDPLEGVLESSMPFSEDVACQMVPVVFVPK